MPYALYCLVRKHMILTATTAVIKSTRQTAIMIANAGELKHT